MLEHLKVVFWDPQPSVRVSTVTSWCNTDEWRNFHASSACLKGSITLDPRKTQKRQRKRVGLPGCSAPLYLPLLYATPAKCHCDLNKMIFKVSLTRMCRRARSCPFSQTDRQGCLDARRLVRTTRRQRVHLTLRDC